ncbi:MAG: hypothetical protein V7L22_02395 [Nostoc sp.]|uniref:hypothetical protein n=1 Tax=Nostoc sp. TaxID=1180 RepID=UPI002FF5808F
MQISFVPLLLRVWQGTYPLILVDSAFSTLYSFTTLYPTIIPANVAHHPPQVNSVSSLITFRRSVWVLLACGIGRD